MMISRRRPVLFLALALIAASHFYQVYSCDGGHGHAHGGHGHGHAHGGHEEANPAFKYSRQANEAHQQHHGHAHDHGHAHGGHDDHHGHAHSHGAHDHGHAHTHNQVKREVKEEPKKAAPSASSSSSANTDSRSSTDKLGVAVLSTLLISIAPFLILFVIPLSNNSDESQPLLKVFLAFASGSLLGDAFLHLIPHALDPHDHHGDDDHSHAHAHSHSEGHDHSAQTKVGLWVLAGIITFFIVEKTLLGIKGGHGHTHSHGPAKPAADKKAKNSDAEDEEGESSSDSKKGKKKDNAKAKASTTPKKEVAKKSESKDEINVAGYLNLAADFAHNFTDGLAIGASYLAGQKIGHITTLTILFHEVPHEIGDYAILIRSGCSRKKAILLQLLTALGALSGTVVSILFEKAMSGVATACILPFTAGGFIYIAAVSIIPELKENSSFGQTIKELIALCVGISMMVVIAYLE